jgi:hypothetical protein
MNKVLLSAAILAIAASSAFADNTTANPTADTTAMMSCMKDGKAMDAMDAKDCETKGGKMMGKNS